MVSRTKLVENSRAKFYENLNQIYKDNKAAPELPQPSTKSVQKALAPKSAASKQPVVRPTAASKRAASAAGSKAPDPKNDPKAKAIVSDSGKRMNSTQREDPKSQTMA
jgi:hypothetical protein